MINNKSMKQKNLILFIAVAVVLIGMAGCSLFEEQTNSNASVEQNSDAANKNQNSNANVSENTNVNKVAEQANANAKTNSDINDLIINAVPLDEVIELLDGGGVIKEWELVSGDPNDTCTGPTYNGEVQIHGWYEWKQNYVEEEWMLHLTDEDAHKMPSDLLASEYFGDGFIASPYVKLQDASAELEEELKAASADDPMALTIKGFRTYCEGYPQVNFDGYTAE